MTNNAFHLDELQLDALTELVNVGVARAATSLRKMIDRQVLLSVPAVEVVTRKTASALIGQRESQSLVGIRQNFEGVLAGNAVLIFPESNASALVRVIVGEESDDGDIPDMEDAVLSETGNIILNACLGSIANQLREPLKMSLPLVRRGASVTLIESEDGVDDEGFVLFVYIDFAVTARDIRGYLALVMDLTSLVVLRRLISEFIERVIAD